MGSGGLFPIFFWEFHRFSAAHEEEVALSGVTRFLRWQEKRGLGYEKILEWMSKQDLPWKSEMEDYLRHQYRQREQIEAWIEHGQDLLGYSRITTTQHYCKVSKRKVESDYFKAMEVVAQRNLNGEVS